MTLQEIPGTFALCRLGPESDLPARFFSATRTPEELSIVCLEKDLPDGIERVQSGWRAFRVAGTLDFSLTGVLAALAQPLAEGEVSIFAISTFDTDYVLVKDLAKARTVLEKAGHRFA